MKLIKKIKSSKIISNMSWIMAGRIVNMILSFVVGVLSTRYLGPNNYGLIGYAASYATFFAAFCSLGIDSVIIKELVDNPKENGKVIGTSLTLKLISSILSFFIINGISFIVDSNDNLSRSIVLIYNVSIVFQVFDIFKFWFRSKLQSKYPVIASIFAYIIVASYKIYLLITLKNVKWFAFVNSLDYILVSILLFVIYKKMGGDKLLFSWNYGKQLLSKSYHFIVTGMMIALFNSTDKFMLKLMLNSSEVAYYTTAVTIASLFTFILSAIIESFAPVIMEAHKNNNVEYEKRNRQLYAIVFYISFAFSFIIAIFANIIIEILYGEKYIMAANPLRILTWYTAFSYLGVARDTWIVCEQKQKYLKTIYLLSALTNIILNYFLIPLYGASGAAFASLFTQFGTIVLFPGLIKELRHNIKLMIDGILLKNIH